MEVSKEQNLNDIFSRLSALGIEVLSMRNKVNRLEEIFMRLVDKSASGVAAATLKRVRRRTAAQCAHARTEAARERHHR